MRYSIIWIFIFLITLTNTTATSYVNVIATNFTGRGITYDGNNIYITCINEGYPTTRNSCEMFGTNTSIIKITENGTITRDGATETGYLPTIYHQSPYTPELKGYALQNFKNYGTTGLYIYPESKQSFPNHETTIKYYIYDYINGYYTLAKTYTKNTFNINSCEPMTLGVYGLIDLRSTYNNNNYFLFDTNPSNYDCTTETGLYNKTGIGNIITYMNNETLLNTLDGEKDSPYYTTKTKYTYTSQPIKNVTINGNYGIILIKNNTVFTTDGNKAYYGTLTDIENNITNTDISILSDSCAGIFSETVKINDIYCTASYDCVIAGKRGNKAAIIGFDGKECYNIDVENKINGSCNNPEHCNLTGKQFYAITYSKSLNRYFITGDNITIGYSSDLTLPIPPQCIDQYTYCSKPLMTQGQVWCDKPDIQYCAQGCINGNCINKCENECNVKGSSKCIDTTNYAVCDDSDGNGCLDYGTIISCKSGEYCRNAYYRGICQEVAQSGIHEIYGMIITPYAISTDNTSYSINNELQTVTVNTVYAIFEQQFYTSGVNYVSRSCNYKETPIYTNTIYEEQALNTTRIMSSAINTASILRLSISPKDYGSGMIEIKSQSGTTASKIYYQRNLTDKNICIYDTSMNPIYCNYDYTGIDTLTSMELEYTFNFQTKTYTIRINYNRTYPTSIATYPITLAANDIYSVLIESNNTSFNYLTLNTIPELPIFTGTSGNTPTVSPCIYSGTGTYKVRTYGNNDGSPDYTVYKDYTVNINGLGLSENQVAVMSGAAGFLNPENYSPAIRYLLVIFSIIILIIIFTGIGYTAQEVKLGLIVGIVLSTFALIIYTVFKWIPAWILVLLVVLMLSIGLIFGLSSRTSASSG